MLLMAGSAHAQSTPPASTPDAIAFDIAVRTPPEFSPLRDLVEKHLELQRYRAVTDLDETELARLMALAEQDVRHMVGTLGYFSPVIRITREEALRPVIAISITPGPATTISNTRISFAGDIAHSPDPAVAAQKALFKTTGSYPMGSALPKTPGTAPKRKPCVSW